MSGRMNRVKDGIARTLQKGRDDIEKSHKNGKIPQDYSLGFINALIFCDHHINMRDGEPKFYDRTSSIGALPKPVALNSGNAIKDEMTFQFLTDDAMLQARGIIDHTKFEGNEIEITEETIIQIKALKKAFDTMESFITDSMEREEAGRGQVAVSSDESCDDQTGSIPVPAASVATQEVHHAGH